MTGDNDVIADYKSSRRMFKEARKQQKLKTGSREQQTLALLEKFKSKLNSAKMLQDYAEEGEEEVKEEEEDETDDADLGISW